ncbi:hypothetical protein Lesp02_70930 [Lentzea sp. NBRC 105346]|uniref:hypothetical protein n=1 Tax=Lentzea sp. NBRC 105346 TaxID=3032205 RepID=UPI0024A25F02|nr:hypothetical protein [Lentzea sp. NBRC 105346]GLZ34906.1 hypothetical protein Lesp02_70930 [Lentzea sp. NBRC 105346]
MSRLWTPGGSFPDREAGGLLHPDMPDRQRIAWDAYDEIDDALKDNDPDAAAARLAQVMREHGRELHDLVLQMIQEEKGMLLPWYAYGNDSPEQPSS